MDRNGKSHWWRGGAVRCCGYDGWEIFISRYLVWGNAQNRALSGWNSYHYVIAYEDSRHSIEKLRTY